MRNENLFKISRTEEGTYLLQYIYDIDIFNFVPVIVKQNAR